MCPRYHESDLARGTMYEYIYCTTHLKVALLSIHGAVEVDRAVFWGSWLKVSHASFLIKF